MSQAARKPDSGAKSRARGKIRVGIRVWVMGEPIEAEAIDLNLGELSVGIVTPYHIALGETHHVEVALPDDPRVIHLLCRLAGIDQPDSSNPERILHLRPEHIDYPDRKRIERFLTQSPVTKPPSRRSPI